MVSRRPGAHPRTAEAIDEEVNWHPGAILDRDVLANFLHLMTEEDALERLLDDLAAQAHDVERHR